MSCTAARESASLAFSIHLLPEFLGAGANVLLALQEAQGPYHGLALRKCVRSGPPMPLQSPGHAPGGPRSL